MRKLLKPFSIFIFAFVLCGFCLNQVGFLINKTPSLPYRYFIWLPSLSPRLNDITTFVHPTYGRLIKRIIGVEGQMVSYDIDGILYVDKKECGRAYAYDFKGRPLQPIKPGIIPKGYAFCAGEHYESMDSRYTRIGLIPTNILNGRLIGVW